MHASIEKRRATQHNSPNTVLGRMMEMWLSKKDLITKREASLLLFSSAIDFPKASKNGRRHRKNNLSRRLCNCSGYGYIDLCKKGNLRIFADNNDPEVKVK